MGDSSPKSKNKQKLQDNKKKQGNAADAAAKQAASAPVSVTRKPGK